MLFTLLAAAALAAPATPDKAEREVRAVFSQIAELTRRQAGQDARTIASLNRAITSLRPRVTRLGAAAVAALAAIASDPRESVSVRIWAISFAALIEDPAAFPFMRRLLLDDGQPAALRASAAGDITRLRLDPELPRRALCAAIEDSKTEGLLLRAVLFELSTRGCPDAAGLNRWAVHFGSRPSEKDARCVSWILSALGRSRSASSAEALLDLFSYYQPGSWQRKTALDALLALPPELGSYRTEALRRLKHAPESRP